MATYYVDNDKTDDSGAGTSWATAKKTIQDAVNPITGTLSGENFICLKSDAADATYGGDVIIEGVRVVGANAKLIIEPRHSDDSTVLWNQTVYNDHTYSPFQSGTSGTWDIKTTRPVTIPAQIEIRNSGTVEIRGVHFDGDSGENARVARQAEIDNTMQEKTRRSKVCPIFGGVVISTVLAGLSTKGKGAGLCMVFFR